MNEFITKASETGRVEVYVPELADRRVVVSVKRFSGRKTTAQLGYFFSAIIQRASKEYGCQPKEMYALLMDACNKKPVVNQKTGEIVYVSFGLSTNDKFETAQTIDRCIQFLAEQGICVETPEEFFERKKIIMLLAPVEG
jgi:hypothetical protein